MYRLKGVRRWVVTVILGAAISAGLAQHAEAQTARIQIIHNSPDPAVNWLSLWLNDIKVADSLLFRNAKPYIEVPSGIGIQAGFAPLNSTSPTEIFKTTTINLDEGKDYVVVILGVVDPNYRTNPDNLPIGLTLLVQESRLEAASLETGDYLFINGVTDAPNLDFSRRGDDPIVSGVPYGTAVGYIPYDKYVYTMDVAPTEAPERLLGFFKLDVGFLKDKAFTVLTSGFLNKFENGNGPELKLMVVSSDGLTLSLGSSEPTSDLATMQIINNSPDLNFPNGFDIYFNGGRAVNNLRFRNATPVFGLPGNSTVTIEVKDATGGGLSIRSTALSVDPGKNYLLMITGVVAPAQYAPNPDGEPTDLAMTINPNLRLFPSALGDAEFIFAHGIPDAPLADMEITDLPEPITAVPFGEMTGYHTMSQFDILAEMVPSSGDLPVIAGHRVNIPFVFGRTFVLYSSGFLRPDRNRNGTKAQLMIALTDGAIVQLRFREVASEAAKLQLIHASPDPAVPVADLYVDYQLVADDAEYKSGTPFVSVAALKTITVSVAPPSSNGVEDAVTNFKMQFDEGGSYAGIVSGVANPASFAPNPDGVSTALGFHVIDGALDGGLDGTQLTVRAANEITDAPTSNFTADGVLMAQGLAYGEASNYTVIPAAYRFVDMKRSAGSARVGASYIDFRGQEGRAGILVGTGFADPSANGDGPGFSTFLVLDDGSTIQADQNVVSTEDDNPEVPGSLQLRGNYPNPFANATNIVMDLPRAAEVSARIVDATGRLVRTIPARMMPAGGGQTLEVAAEDLPSGVYLYSVSVASSNATSTLKGQMMIVK